MPQYRTVWVLRGYLTVEDERCLVRTAEEDYGLLLESYKRYSGKLDTKYYNLALRKEATSKRALLSIVRDPDTAAIAWHSHADSAGAIYAAGRADIIPGDIRKSGVSPNLAFVALLGCKVGRFKKKWVDAFGLNHHGDGMRRLAASSTYVSLYETESPIPGQSAIRSWVRKFVEDGASQAELMIKDAAYHFPDWIEMLPTVPQQKNSHP